MNAPQPLVKSRRDRFLKTCGGFALLTIGVPMLFLPGPGAPAIVLGLTLLGGEYPWANRALSQIERPTQWLRGTLKPSWHWARRRIYAAAKKGSDIRA